MTTAAEIDRLLHYMPILVRDGGVSDWERKFCASMVAAQRRKGFRVSAKQIAVMARIVSSFQKRTLRDDHGDVVDDDQNDGRAA